MKKHGIINNATQNTWFLFETTAYNLKNSDIRTWFDKRWSDWNFNVIGTLQLYMILQKKLI